MIGRLLEGARRDALPDVLLKHEVENNQRQRGQRHDRKMLADSGAGLHLYGAIRSDSNRQCMSIGIREKRLREK